MVIMAAFPSEPSAPSLAGRAWPQYPVATAHEPAGFPMNGVILMVDDNADDIYLTTRAFRRDSITNEIVVARDGVEALDLLLPEDGRDPLRPVIILLDIHMPRLNGLEVLARLRAEPSTRSLPVMVLTTSDEERDIAESYSHGSSTYVQKPVSTDEFVEAARMLGVYWMEPPVRRC
jgi:two-component system response regulator